jgi:N-methylhydantoinase A
VSAAMLGIDVGGTFTDLVWVDDNGISFTAKSPTTRRDQAVGVMNGVAALAETVERSAEELLRLTGLVVCGTTVATNAMIEFDGAKTAMLTTRGFRDIVDIRRNYKEAAFDLRLPAPVSVVPRRRRISITERVDYNGIVLTPLVEDEVRAAGRRMLAERVEAVAVCYLFSFLNGDHERQTAEILAEECPAVHVSLSHETLPRIREFERFSTTVVDAYVTPLVRGYLQRLERQLRDAGFHGDFLIVRSNGGVAEVRHAASSGVQLVTSGPASGVVAASNLGAMAGEPDLLTFDMGGTSSDVALIRRGVPTVGTDAWVSRWRVAIPMVDVTSIGAGGGSIAWVDDGGALRIGPASAGADPGPACYSRGGTAPTVTDANLLLGYISPDGLLGGRIRLDREAAHAAIEASVATPLGISVDDAVAALLRLVNHNMANQLRMVSIGRGYDVRDFVLVAYGGSGPLHASAMIAEIGIRRALVPRGNASVFCAVGGVVSDIRESRAQGYFVRSSLVDLVDLARAIASLVERADAAMSANARAFERLVECALEMRYRGQTHEVAVPVSADFAPTEESWAGVVARFHALHEERYGFARLGAETEIIGIYADRFALRTRPEFREGEQASGAVAPIGFRRMFVPNLEEYVSAAIYPSERVRPGFSAAGPLVVEEAHTSVVVFPDQVLRVDHPSAYTLEAGA